MPDPDAQIQSHDIADKAITDRTLDDDLSTATFTATTNFTGPYETRNSANNSPRLRLVNGQLFGYTGDFDESGVGSLHVAVSGSGATRTLQLSWHVPSFIDDVGGVSFVARSASFDDSTTPPGWVFADSGASTQTATILLQNEVGITLGIDSKLDLTEARLEIPTGTSDPSSPVDGLMFLDTTANELRCYEGGAWRTIASW